MCKSDEMFEMMAKEIGYCDVNKCAIFQRHFTQHYAQPVSVTSRIMDRIHCYCQHSFDIGSRLSSGNKEILHKLATVNENTNNDFKNDITHVDTIFISLLSILEKEKTKLSQSYFNYRYYRYYQDTISSNTHKSHNRTDLVTETCNLYCLGHDFCYCATEEYCSCSRQ
eukprot:18853_1